MFPSESIHNENKIGPSKEPCGTSWLTSVRTDDSWLVFTLKWYISVRLISYNLGSIFLLSDPVTSLLMLTLPQTSHKCYLYIDSKIIYIEHVQSLQNYTVVTLTLVSLSIRVLELQRQLNVSCFYVFFIKVVVYSSHLKRLAFYP